MSKIYNPQHHIATNFTNFLKNIFPNIRKTQLIIIHYIVFGMISAESSVASDIAKRLKDDFSKNSRCYTKTKITTHKTYNGNIKKRVLSLFNTGLTLFKLAFNSPVYIRLPFNFILYDI